MTTYHIPVNYTDAGRLFGMFEIRNTIEAVILALPLSFLCAYFLPFSLTVKIIVTMIVLIPAGGFALNGINDESLTQFIFAWRRWRKSRKILTFRGSDA